MAIAMMTPPRPIPTEVLGPTAATARWSVNPLDQALIPPKIMMIW